MNYRGFDKIKNRWFLILAIACFLAFISYEIYTTFKGQGINELEKDKKQSQRQRAANLHTNQQDFTTSKDPMKVKGVVREINSKNPLKGARVKIQRNIGELQLVTDEDGSFEFEIDFNETVHITATLKGYTDGKLMYHRGKEAILELRKCGVITGTITHKQSHVSGAEVGLFSFLQSDAINQTESDSNGNFTIIDVPPFMEMNKIRIEEIRAGSALGIHPYELKIEHPEYCPVLISDIKVKEGETLFYKIELTRPGIIEGSIYNESFKLINNATVHITASDCDHSAIDPALDPAFGPNLHSSNIFKGKDVSNGKYNLKLPQGYYHIIADPRGNFIPYKSRCIKLATGERMTHDIFLKTAKSITGIVTDETLKPLSNVRVNIHSGAGADAEMSRSLGTYFTMGDGKFSFERLPDGFYMITARDSGDNYYEAKIENVMTGTSDLRIILKKKAFEDRKAGVEVKITSLTSKVSQYVYVHFINEDRDKTTVYTGGQAHNGIFKKEEYVQAGRYTIVVIDKEQNLYSIIHNQYIIGLQNNLISILLDKKGSKIRGKVLNSAIGSVMIQVFVDTDKKRSFFEFIDLDDEGNFEISGLPSCYIEIDFRGDKSKNLKFDLQPYEIKDLGTIDLKE